MVKEKDIEVSIDLDDFPGKKGKGVGRWCHVGFDSESKKNPYEVEGARMFKLAQSIGGTSQPKALLYKALREYLKMNGKIE